MAEAIPGIFSSMALVPEIALADPARLGALLQGAEQPFIIRGLVADWPLVQAGQESASAARDYLLRHQRNRSFAFSIGDPAAGGRLYYNAAMGMNFRSARGKLTEIFAQMDGGERGALKGPTPTIYLASIDIGEHFEGLSAENPISLGNRDCLESIWIGSATRIAAHNDFPDNLACCAVGRRRFTLFPPEQFRNLYLGPLDNTPAGRAISMVDFHGPDFDTHPRFRDALEQAQFAELEPGDVIYIPSMWWHHVEGLDPFNILVNYWWRESPRWMGQPQNALNHAIMSIRDLPDKDKQIWRDLFEYYVFENKEDVVSHIPEEARSVLGPLDAEGAGRLRAFLIRALNQ